MPLERHDANNHRMRSNAMLRSMNTLTENLANEDEKKDLFDSQASPHSADTKATVGMNKTMRDTMRDTMRGIDTNGGLSSARKSVISKKSIKEKMGLEIQRTM